MLRDRWKLKSGKYSNNVLGKRVDDTKTDKT